MQKNLKRNLQPTADNAAAYLTDLIGVRIVVHFIGDVYEIAARIKEKYGCIIWILFFCGQMLR